MKRGATGTGRNRTSADICSQILEIAIDGISKTKIMHQAYLSYTQLVKYLDVLGADGLLEFDPERKVFKTSPKGIELLVSPTRPVSASGLSAMTT